MSAKLYMDVHVHRDITNALRLRGVDVLTAQEDGAGTLSDPDLMDRATVLGRVLFTYDRDHLVDAANRQREGRPFSGVIHQRLSTLVIGRCISDLDTLIQAGDPPDFADQVHYLSFQR